jgi:hypothetical protein
MSYEVHHALVFERYGETMAIEHNIPYLLPVAEEGY